MADPTKFVPGYDYTSWQASNPTKPLPANKVDQDMANIATSIDEAVEAIKNVRRSDGALKNEIVTLDSLSPQVAAGVGAGALASAEAAAASADAAADSAVAAAASATAAGGSATAASGYASTALTYRNAADGFADDSAAAATLSQTARDFAAAWATAGSGVDVNDRVNPVGKSAYHWAQVALDAAAGSVADGSITTAKLANGALSADTTGRAKMADSFVSTAKIADGALSADTTGRAKMADGFVSTAKIADNSLSADTTGRAKMADGFVTSAKIADGTIANADLADMTQATIKGRASGAGTGAPSDLAASDVFAILGGLVPAKPQTASGVGQFTYVQTSVGAGYTLPAGGTWVYLLLCFSNSTGVLAGGASGAGVAAGGTTVATTSAGNIYIGFAWRIG